MRTTARRLRVERFFCADFRADAWTFRFGEAFRRVTVLTVVFRRPLAREADADAAERLPVLRRDSGFRERVLRLAISGPLTLVSAPPRHELGSEATLTVYL